MNIKLKGQAPRNISMLSGLFFCKCGPDLVLDRRRKIEAVKCLREEESAHFLPPGSCKVPVDGLLAFLEM